MAKELSMTALDKIIKAKALSRTNTLAYNIDGTVFEIEVKYTIPMGDMIDLVNTVVDNLFVSGDNGETIYTPARLDLAMAANILKHYTNLKSDLGETRLVSILYGSKLMEDIINLISASQLMDIEKYVDQFTGSILTSINSAQESKLNELARSFDQAASAFQTFTDQLSSFGGENMQKALNNIIQMTPKTLTRAVIEENK